MINAGFDDDYFFGWMLYFSLFSSLLFASRYGFGGGKKGNSPCISSRRPLAMLSSL